ncbi:MAG TPA: ATP-binding protein, partial [Kofleriaceae bacterium]|nr:ATP-binding protein [Kofleriaceae bacterium]
GEFTRLAPTADTATILLVENDRLRVRAIAGTDRPMEDGFSLAFGEGFSGTIAATREPLALQDAESDPIIKSEVFRDQGVRALYGVPLLANDRVIGVAHMGSRRVSELSADDRHLFTSMAARAAAGIHHHMLRQQLQQSEEQARALAAERASVLGKLESLLAAAPVGIGFVDRDLRYLRVNDTLAALNGKPSAEHLGRRVDEVLPRTGPALSRVLQRILDTGTPVLDWELTASLASSPGEPRTFVAYYFPVRHASGEVTGVGAVVLEVTERKAIETQLREALRDRDDMLAIVSHDLRNPLGAIKLSATLLEARDADPRVRKHVEMIERTVERMERLIEDLLDTAAIRAGKLAVELCPEPAAAVLSEAIDLQAPLAAEKQITFDRRSDLGDVAILCDRNRILQLFGNILANALRFSRAGDTITVTAAREGDHVRFAIADRGPGIAPDLAAEIFEPYRAAPQQQRRTSGLGLFIARGIVDAHGGRIWVESEPGNGATFVFTIPIAR